MILKSKKKRRLNCNIRNHLPKGKFIKHLDEEMEMEEIDNTIKIDWRNKKNNRRKRIRTWKDE